LTIEGAEWDGLGEGHRVGLIGGGPAGSFFSIFLLNLAAKLDLGLEVDIFEPRDFSRPAPYGCNMCGGIISESLVQLLAAEGINLPPAVVQRGIDSYVLHTNEEKVRIDTPHHEKRIGAVHRGAGPRDLAEAQWHSFDGHLLDHARELGARVVPERIKKVEKLDELWRLHDAAGTTHDYELLVVATGVNAGALKLFHDLPIRYRPPETKKTFIREYFLGQDLVDQLFGNSMHVFLMDLPGLEFAALIPKGEYVTVCLLGEKLDQTVLKTFLDSAPVRSCFPADWESRKQSCQCSPWICVESSEQPYGDGLVFIGDSGATRLYKDGIGAAYRTAKAAATTAIFEGVRAQDFERHYWPACRSIARDNRLGKLAFWAAGQIQRHRFARRAVVQMTRDEQEGSAETRMSHVLWDLFTGSAPYREILIEGAHPVFLGRMTWNLARALAGALTGGRA
jgi:flavin-dependent dehydrogenase